MKATIFHKFTLLTLLLSGVVVSNHSIAQSGKTKSDAKDSKTSIKIRVTEDENGKERNIEKSYRVGAMSDAEREQFVEKVLDSLNVDKKKKQTISITVDDGDDDVIAAKKRKKVIINHRDDREPLAYHWKDDFSTEFDFNTEKFRRHMNDFEKEIKPKTKILMRDMENFGERMGDFWDKEVMKPANVRSLNAYSNNPDNGILNLRFNVPDKGDVTVTVTDTKGKEVGKKEIKDFEGEFVGQIELKKNTKGTLFVTVVQNEDGTVKRVVIP